METLDYLVDLLFILALLDVPAFFLWRHVVRVFTRAEQLVEPERIQLVSHSQDSNA